MIHTNTNEKERSPKKSTNNPNHRGGYTPMMRLDGVQTCVQFVPTTSFLVGSCGHNGAVYTPFSVGNELGTKTFRSFSVSAPMLQVVYQATDLSMSTTTSSESSISEPSAKTSPSSSSTSSASSSSASGNHDTGLSTGAIIGIAFGATIAGLFLIALGLWWYRRRGRAHAHARGHASDGNDATSGYETVPSPGSQDVVEVSGTSAWPHNHNNGYRSELRGGEAEVHGSPEWRWNDGVAPRTLEVNPNDPAELSNRIVPVEIGSSYSPRGR